MRATLLYIGVLAVIGYFAGALYLIAALLFSVVLLLAAMSDKLDTLNTQQRTTNLLLVDLCSDVNTINQTPPLVMAPWGHA